MYTEESNNTTSTPKKQPIWHLLHPLHTGIKISLLAFFVLILYILHHIYAYITPPPLLYIADRNESTPLLTQLQQQGVPLTILDYRLTKRYPYPPSGWVRFDPKQKRSRSELIAALQTLPREKTRRVVMYSGDTIQEFAAKTGKQTDLPPEAILKQYHHFSPYRDGGIIAGYYRIPYRTTPLAISYYTTHSSLQRFEQMAEQYLESYTPKTWNRILTIASIIQKETQNPKEMPFISSVIHNRLAKDMKLQLDATLNYGKYSHQIVTPERIKNDKSRYNTYKYKGLPPHPLGSATEEAIIAALSPAKTDYLYFMLADKGSHNFAATYPEHLAHIRWYHRQQEKKQQEANRSKNTTNKVLDTIHKP